MFERFFSLVASSAIGLYIFFRRSVFNDIPELLGMALFISFISYNIVEPIVMSRSMLNILSSTNTLDIDGSTGAPPTNL